MRADRLVAILLLLQSRGQVTAADVAAELEVSERTARRDLDALGTAGLPIYSVQGRGGGWRLAGGGRTDLSGLTAAEARALFLVAGSSATVTPEVRTALRKLVRALPEPFRPAAEAASTSIVVDPKGWDGGGDRSPPPPLLDEVQRCVVEGERITLGYRARDGALTTRVCDPLGLAAKGRSWYLIAGTDVGLRTFRVDRITEVDARGEPVVRPDGFELSEAWTLIADEIERKRMPVTVSFRTSPETVPLLRHVFGPRVRIGRAGPEQVAMELRGYSVQALGGEIAGFGAAVEVDDPPELRALLRRIGADLVAAYSDDATR